MEEHVDPGARAAAGVRARPGLVEAARAVGRFDVVCRGRDGQVKWRETFANLVTNAGRNDLLDKYFKGSTYTAAWYVGLKSAGSPAAADTMSSHGAWTEVEDYDEATREALVLGSVASQSVDNSAAVATFTMNATVTVAGAFLTTGSVKGGTAGILYSAGNFNASRAVADDDVIEVTYTLTS